MAWLAKDKDGSVYLYILKPKKVGEEWLPEDVRVAEMDPIEASFLIEFPDKLTTDIPIKI